MRPIAEGQSVALMAPTGTGKTLAYLLPLWQRLQRSALSSRGPKLLIVTPSEDLQGQVGFVARVLAGPRMAEAVLVLQRGVARHEMATALAIITTPALLMELVGQPDMADVWQECMSSIDVMVVDEADSLLPMGGARTWVLGDLLDEIMEARRNGGSRPLQMVAVSASIDTNTLNLLEDTVGVEMELIRGGAVGATSGGEEEDQDPEEPSIAELWPTGLRHTFNVRERLLERSGAVSPYSITSIAQAIATLQPTRCLVIFAEKRKLSERGGSLGRYITRLRKALLPQGYQVATVSAAVQGLIAGGPTRPSRPQVILGRSETIRGLDIPGVDTVVIVGALSTAREYLHLAGRTARCDPGTGATAQGTVCSILGNVNAKSLKKWSREMGFQLERLWLDDPADSDDAGRRGGPRRRSGKGSGRGSSQDSRSRTSIYENLRI